MASFMGLYSKWGQGEPYGIHSSGLCGKTYFSECQWNGESIPDQTGVESDKGNGP